MTGLEYIQGALELLGVQDAGEGVEPEDSSTALRWLTSMLNSWSGEIGGIYQDTQESFTVTTAQLQYTIGPTGDFVTTRPITFIKAVLRDVQNVDHDLRLMPNREYQDFALKSPGDALPWAMGYNMTNPDVTITFYPPPDTTYTLRLTTAKELTAPALNTEYVVPPGYDDAIQWGLAVRLGPVFGRSNIVGSPANPASIAGMAADMYRQLIISNTEPEGIGLDPLQPGNAHVLRSWKYAP